MNLATIALKNTRRNLFRTLLTILGVAVAMLAFLLLRTVLSAWLVGVEYSAKDRVATRHKVTFVMTLPRRYVDDAANLPGVKGVTWFNWFGAHVPGKEDQFFGNFAIDPKSFFGVYDEVALPPDQKSRFLDDRRGAIVGLQLARQFGWKVGDHVTLEGTIYPGMWEFNIDGIYSSTRKSLDQSSFYFHWDYLNDSVPDAQKEQVGW
ncbi:MAG TPA: ABC transporter permease, partial [Polyangiales bacterium]